MSHISSVSLRAGFMHPILKTIAGLGAALLLAVPSFAVAASRECTVAFNVSSATQLGALQISIDYDGASDVGDLASCDVVQPGLDDEDIDAVADTAVIGWADEDGFNGPAPFATCTFSMPDITDADPASSDFAVTVEDASNHNVPATPVSPTIAVVVSGCITTACDTAPLSGCKIPTVAGKSKLLFKNNAIDTKDQGQFQWKSGAATDLADFQNPTVAGKVVSWCVYENGALLAGYNVPSGAGWTATGEKGFQFKGDVDGISQIKLKTGIAGKASVAVKGKSKVGNFHSPALELSAPVVTQLAIAGTTVSCFQSTAGVPTKNDAFSFSAKGNP